MVCSIRCAIGVAFVGLVAAGCAVESGAAVDEEAAAEPVAEVAEALTAVTHSCVCIGTACGNNAIGGANGDVKTGLTTAKVIASYGPDRTGSARTGWACLAEGVNSCVCVGLDPGGDCGNGAIGASNGALKTGLTTAKVIASYGPDRTGSARTGWKCRLSGL